MNVASRSSPASATTASPRPAPASSKPTLSPPTARFPKSTAPPNESQSGSGRTHTKPPIPVAPPSPPKRSHPRSSPRSRISSPPPTHPRPPATREVVSLGLKGVTCRRCGCVGRGVGRLAGDRVPHEEGWAYGARVVCARGGIGRAVAPVGFVVVLTCSACGARVGTSARSRSSAGSGIHLSVERETGDHSSVLVPSTATLTCGASAAASGYLTDHAAAACALVRSGALERVARAQHTSGSAIRSTGVRNTLGSMAPSAHGRLTSP